METKENTSGKVIRNQRIGIIVLAVLLAHESLRQTLR